MDNIDKNKNTTYTPMLIKLKITDINMDNIEIINLQLIIFIVFLPYLFIFLILIYLNYSILNNILNDL